MHDSQRLRGIVPPMSTPLTDAGDIDMPAISILVQHFLDARVHGLFVLGTTGEAPYLTNTQRAGVVEATATAVSGTLPVLAGCIDTALARVVEQAVQAKDSGADYLVVAPPFYARGNDEETYRHYAMLRDQVDLPLIAYNIPSRTNTRLSPELTSRLAGDRIIEGIKDSSGDVTALRHLLHAHGTRDFSVMTGSDLQVDLAMLMGADGAVPGLANVDPVGFVDLFEAAEQGDWAKAGSVQDRLVPLFRIITLGQRYGVGPDSAAYGGIKAAMHLRGFISTHQLAHPQSALPTVAVEEIARILADASLI